MKVQEMTKMKDMDRAKPHCQMVTHMKECMKMESDMVMAFIGIFVIFL